MASARHLTIEYARRIPLQIDGETRWLEPDEFPLEMEVFSDSIPILSPA
jgi:diacylglycerol kinase family enzyme